MRKFLIISLLALVLISPNLASAQVTQEEVNQQLIALINSLMKQVQELLTKLVAIETQQTAQVQALGALQSQPTPAPVTPPVVTTPAPVTWIDLPQDNPYPTATPKNEEWTRVIGVYNHNEAVPSDLICSQWQYRVDTFKDADAGERLEACHAALGAIKALFVQ